MYEGVGKNFPHYKRKIKQTKRTSIEDLIMQNVREKKNKQTNKQTNKQKPFPNLNFLSPMKSNGAYSEVTLN